MGEIRFVGTGETRGYPYLVCKKVNSRCFKVKVNLKLLISQSKFSGPKNYFEVQFSGPRKFNKENR